MAAASERGEPLVELFVPALSNVAWSSEVVGQTLEGLFVYLASDGTHHLHPVHAPTLRLGWRPDEQPGEVLLAAAERYGLAAALVHSTSWRFEDARVVLTYVVAVRPPERPSEYLTDVRVARADLARGDAMGPPTEIGVTQVLEHAFRHLAWLVKDDEAVRRALPDWAAFIGGYEPEPFRSFGAQASRRDYASTGSDAYTRSTYSRSMRFEPKCEPIVCNERFMRATQARGTPRSSRSWNIGRISPSSSS
jgi:hypothetical protein